MLLIQKPTARGTNMEGEVEMASCCDSDEPSTLEEFNWKDSSVWRQSAHNTKWCLIGCSIGEFGTLAYYSYSGITEGLEIYSRTWILYAILPLINGLITSVILETILLMKGQMDFKDAL